MIVLHYHTDKFDRTDPTGTARVRRNFRGQARLRWQRISVLTKDMLVTNDMLALKGGGLSTIHQPAVQGGATKIDIFQRWFDLTLNTILLNLNGDFMKPLLDEAYAMGETFGQDRMQTTNRNPMAAQRLLTLQKLAFIEMQGIIEAASQQSVRAVANGLLHNRTPSQISVTIRGIIRKIGVIRSNALADMLVVKSFNEAALDVYEAAGLTHVGVLAEMRARFMATDAGPGSRISRTKAPSTRTVQRIRKAARELERRLGRSVAIRTAGDDDVCPICEDIEEDGPYPIDTARSLIPAHPHCRCAFVPVMDKRYAETDDSTGFSAADRISEVWVSDDYNPSQPRDPAGTSTGGQWTSTGAVEEYQSGIVNSKNGGYVNVQSFLRTGKISYPHGGFTNEAAAEHAAALLSAFSRSRLPKDMTVHRGMVIRKTDPQDLLKAKIGEIISNPGVTSATTSAATAAKFADPNRERHTTPVKIEIKLKTGTPAIVIGGHEKEIAIAPRTKFKVVGRSVRSGTTYIKLETQEEKN